MSILEQYGKLPSVDDMMAALASPVVPKGATEVEHEMQLSTDDMIKEMFTMIKNQTYNNPGDGGGMGTGGCC